MSDLLDDILDAIEARVKPTICKTFQPREHDAPIMRVEGRISSRDFLTLLAAARNWRRATSPIGDVARERQRQIEVEGWTAEHDDRHPPGELILAAVAYALIDSEDVITMPLTQAPPPRPADEPIDDDYQVSDLALLLWPWEKEWWKPKDTRRNLVIAAALILAEIDRLDRADARTSGKAIPPVDVAGNPLLNAGRDVLK